MRFPPYLKVCGIFCVSLLFHSICLTVFILWTCSLLCLESKSLRWGQSLTFVSHSRSIAVLNMESSFLSPSHQFQIHVKGCQNSTLSISVSAENKMIDSVPNWGARHKKQMAENWFWVLHLGVHLNCIEGLRLKRPRERISLKKLGLLCLPTFIHPKWERLRDPWKLKD